MEINCTFAPTVDTPQHIAQAEQLGYERAWVYDSPLLYADPYVTLALAAAQTERIRLGVCVISPHLRHVATNAAATAHLCALAPGRIDMGVGAGFTSAALLGRKPSRWVDVERYVRAFRGLLAGEVVDWDGEHLALMHGARSGISDRCDVPIWIAAHGPVGFAAAERLGAGVVTNPAHGDNPVPVDGTCIVTFHGTVLEDGESLDAPRVLDAAGPGAALGLHLGAHGPVAGLPEQEAHTAAVAALAPERARQELHRGHLIEPNELDARHLSAAVIERATVTAPPAGVRGFLDHLAANGAAGVLYQPAGSDIERELRAFAAAAGLSPRS